MTARNIGGCVVHMHDPTPADVVHALIALAGCCYNALDLGPAACTCWEPVYDLVQQPPVVGPVETRDTMCADCAYRPDSPERSGDDRYAHGDQLDDIVLSDSTPFWCHQGIRKPVAWKHPAGITVAATTDCYDPPQGRDPASGRMMPYRADGSPANICAGWAKRAELVKNVADVI